MTVKRRYQPFTVTTPSGVASTAPHTTPVTLGDVTLIRVDWRIPPGPSGLVGFLITFNGQSIVPWNKTHTFLVGTDEKDSVPVGVEITKHLTIKTYNTDIRPHTVYFRFLYMPMTLTAATTAPLPSAVVLG